MSTKTREELAAKCRQLANDLAGKRDPGSYSADRGWLTLEQLIAGINALAAASSADGVERDAARYRWLRERHEIAFPASSFPTIPWVVRIDRPDSMPAMLAVEGCALDAATDAAMLSAAPSNPPA